MKNISYLLVAVMLLVAGCETNPASKSARQCQHGLEVANKELNFAKAKGFSGTVEFAKAATLLTGAAIQYEFGKYSNCIDKVKRARKFIKRSQIKN
ncbi:MAG: hypothetical protein KAJ39_09205 [Gammaproteobacteria bacterium]|nr:hypothetical protein [Gammaproteobacteria bacterium]